MRRGPANSLRRNVTAFPIRTHGWRGKSLGGECPPWKLTGPRSGDPGAPRHPNESWVFAECVSVCASLCWLPTRSTSSLFRSSRSVGYRTDAHAGRGLGTPPVRHLVGQGGVRRSVLDQISIAYGSGRMREREG